MDWRSCRESYAPAPRRRLNPFLHRTIQRSGRRFVEVAIVAGFPHKQTLSILLREESVSATPLLVARLQRVATAIGFPKDEIFLDEATR
jgi:hypothetical protein